MLLYSYTKLLGQCKIIFYGLSLLNLSSLNDRSSLLLSTFLRNLILGLNNCSELLALIQFKINSFNARNPKYINS